MEVFWNLWVAGTGLSSSAAAVLPESSKSKTGLKTKRKNPKKTRPKRTNPRTTKPKRKNRRKTRPKRKNRRKANKQQMIDTSQGLSSWGANRICRISVSSHCFQVSVTHTHMHIIVALFSCQGDFLRFQHYSTAAMEIKPWICCGTLICSPMVAMNTCSFMPHNQATTLVHWLRLRQAFIALPCAGASDGEDQVDKMKRLKHNIISVH